MLLTHGAKDYRVVLDDAIAGFNVLQRQGVPSRLVVFTDEGHLILKPVNALRWWQEIFRWCEVRSRRSLCQFVIENGSNGRRLDQGNRMLS